MPFPSNGWFVTYDVIQCDLLRHQLSYTTDICSAFVTTGRCVVLLPITLYATDVTAWPYVSRVLPHDLCHICYRITSYVSHMLLHDLICHRCHKWRYHVTSWVTDVTTWPCVAGVTIWPHVSQVLPHYLMCHKRYFMTSCVSQMLLHDLMCHRYYHMTSCVTSVTMYHAWHSFHRSCVLMTRGHACRESVSTWGGGHCGLRQDLLIRDTLRGREGGVGRSWSLDARLVLGLGCYPHTRSRGLQGLRPTSAVAAPAFRELREFGAVVSGHFPFRFIFRAFSL